jgi:hypothetical protein
MPNTNKPFGLRPYSTLSGAPISGSLRKFFVPATDATAIFVGDPVKLAGTEGSLYPDDLPVPTVTVGTIAAAFVGVVVGVEPLPGNLELNYRKASTAMYVLVDCSPDTLFLVQGDADTYDAADIGLNCSLTFTAGSTTTGVSAMTVDQSLAAVTATLDVQLIGSAPVPGNDLTGGYPLFLVKLNNHQYVDGTTGL